MDAWHLDLEGTLNPAKTSSSSESSSVSSDTAANNAVVEEASLDERENQDSALGESERAVVTWDERDESNDNEDSFWSRGQSEAAPVPSRSSSSKTPWWGVGMTMHMDTFGGVGIVGDRSASTPSSTTSSVASLSGVNTHLSDGSERHAMVENEVEKDVARSVTSTIESRPQHDVAGGSSAPPSGSSTPTLSSGEGTSTPTERRRRRSDSFGSDADQASSFFSRADQSDSAAVDAAAEENPNAKVVVVIGRDVDQPDLVVEQLTSGVGKETEGWSDIYFKPIVIPHSTLTHSDCSDYLTKGRVDVLVLCYNTTQTRIMLTSTRGGYYRHLLPYAKRVIGETNILFVLSHCATNASDLVDTALEFRLKGQPHMETFFDQHRVLSWEKEASDHQRKRFLEIVNASRRPTNECSIL